MRWLDNTNKPHYCKFPVLTLHARTSVPLVRVAADDSTTWSEAA